MRSRTLKTRISSGLLALAATALLASPAMAQETSDVDTLVNNTLFTTSTGLTTTTVAALAPFLTTSTSAGGGSQSAPPPKRPPQKRQQRYRTVPPKASLHQQQRNQQVMLFLRAEANGLHQAIAAGGGEASNELAAHFAIPAEQQRDFMLLLRDNRAAIIPLLDDNKVTPARTLQFTQTVEGLMAKDARFAPIAHEIKVWESSS